MDSKAHVQLFEKLPFPAREVTRGEPVEKRESRHAFADAQSHESANVCENSMRLASAPRGIRGRVEEIRYN